jgi:3-deoxy-D-manno-octulosonate 8-phosphate phosphatase (KDO 8-P phosphatase)
MIKLVALDIDGVLTNGKKEYDLNGKVVGKEFFDRDFSYINRMLMMHGVEVCFLSGDDRVNETLAKLKGIPFLFSVHEKDKILGKYLEKRGIEWAEVAYVGDDLTDMATLSRVGEAFVPASASPYLKQSGYCELPARGGEGVVEALYYYLERYKLI